MELLNYALALKYLQATLYNHFLGGSSTTPAGPNVVGPVAGNPSPFTEAQFGSSSFFNGANNTVNSNLYRYMTTARDFTLNSATTLRNVITQQGGTPVQPCNYRFPSVTSFDQFVQTAQSLANTAVSAHVGIIGELDEPNLVQAVASILAVKARQAAFLNLISGGVFTSSGMAPTISSGTGTGTGGTNAVSGPSGVPGLSQQPFSSAFDAPLATSQVSALVTPYLASCPTPLPSDGPSGITVSPNNTTTGQQSLTINATLPQGGGQAQMVQYQVAPGGLVPAILQGMNSTSAMIQFVGGSGVYFLQLVVTDQSGRTTATPITLTGEPTVRHGLQKSRAGLLVPAHLVSERLLPGRPNLRPYIV